MWTQQRRRRGSYNITFPEENAHDEWIDGFHVDRPAKIWRIMPDSAPDPLDDFLFLGQHPNLGILYGYEDEEKEDIRYIAFEHSKLNLADFREDVDDFDEVRSIVQQITQAVEYIHSTGFVHLGLRKPESYIIVGKGQVKLSLQHCQYVQHNKGYLDERTNIWHSMTSNMEDLAEAITFLFCGLGVTPQEFTKSYKVEAEGDTLPKAMNLPKIPKMLAVVTKEIHKIYEPEARDFVSSILYVKRSDRLLNHTLFWDARKRLCFVRDIHEKCSERIEKSEISGKSDFVNKELNGMICAIHRWDGDGWDKLDDKMLADFSFVPHHIVQSRQKQALVTPRWNDEEPEPEPEPEQEPEQQQEPHNKSKSMREFLAAFRHFLSHVAGFKALSLGFFVKLGGIHGDVTRGIEKYFATALPNLIIRAYIAAQKKVGYLDPYFRQYLDRSAY